MSTAESPVAPAPVNGRPFNQGSLYKGVVVKQMMTADRDGHPQLLVYVDLQGMLVDSRNAESGLLPCHKAQVEVRVRFPSDNPQVLEFSARDLATLGFTGDDIEQLNPQNKKFHDFKGKEVYLTPSYRTFNGNEYCYWNVRQAPSRRDEPLAAGSLKKSPAAQAYREALAARQKAAEGEPAPF